MKASSLILALLTYAILLPIDYNHNSKSLPTCYTSRYRCCAESADVEGWMSFTITFKIIWAKPSGETPTHSRWKSWVLTLSFLRGTAGRTLTLEKSTKSKHE